MEWSKIMPAFITVFTTLVTGIANNPLPQDYDGIFERYSYMAPMLWSSMKLGTEVEVAIRVEKLRAKDPLAKLHPICYTYIRSFDTIKWTQVHQTEMIDNDCSPIFAEKPVLSSTQAKDMLVKFEIYNDDQVKNNFLGSTEITLETLISLRTQTLFVQKPEPTETRSDSDRAKIIVTAEKLIENHDRVTLKISSDDFAESFSHPYMEVLKVSFENNFVLVYRTEVQNIEERSVEWTFTVPMRNLCNGDDHRALIFACWNLSPDGKPSLIGHFQTNMYELRASHKNNFALRSKTGDNVAQIEVKPSYIQRTKDEEGPNKYNVPKIVFMDPFARGSSRSR